MTTEALTAIKAALAAGRWEASVYHCPPPRRRTDNPLKHAATLRLKHGLPSEAVALSEAKAAIESGWGNTTSIHRETASPSASFYLPYDHLAALGRDLPALISSYEEMERRVAELEEALKAIPKELWGLTAKKSQEGKKAAAINIRTSAKIADQISSRALSPAGEEK